MLEKALALEGGSLRCMFSAGAVDVMMEQGLLFDGVFGVSAGALTGINYVSRQIGRTARINLEYVNDKRYLGVRNLLLHRSIFNFDFMFGELSDHLIPLDREAVRTTPCRFTAVATDCRTGKGLGGFLPLVFLPRVFSELAAFNPCYILMEGLKMAVTARFDVFAAIRLAALAAVCFAGTAVLEEVRRK